MEHRRERENERGAAVEPLSGPPETQVAAPLCALAGGVAAARSALDTGAVIDPGTIASIRAADRWLAAKPVRTDLAALERRILGCADGDRIEAQDQADDAVKHARELILVAFVTGHDLGLSSGHRAGRGAAAIAGQVEQLTQAERRAASAAAIRDASIREELGGLLGLPTDASWTRILEVVDTLRRAAKIVASMFGAGGPR